MNPQKVIKPQLAQGYVWGECGNASSSFNNIQNYQTGLGQEQLLSHYQHLFQEAPQGEEGGLPRNQSLGELGQRNKAPFTPQQAAQKNFHFSQHLQALNEAETKRVTHTAYNTMNQPIVQNQFPIKTKENRQKQIEQQLAEMNQQIEMKELQLRGQMIKKDKFEDERALWGQAPTHQDLLMHHQEDQVFNPFAYPGQDQIDQQPLMQSTPTREQRCFASGHKNCSPKIESTHRRNPRNIYDQMKMMDHDFRSQVHKNNDHFHLVKAEQVYERPNLVDAHPGGEQLLTATVYSDDSEKVREKKEKQKQYGQILIDQMLVKKEKALKEKAFHLSVLSDLESREKPPKIKVTDIPRPLPQAQVFYPFQSFAMQQKDNFGFFDKFYGPERQMEHVFQQAKAKELHDQLSDQVVEKQTLELSLKNQHLLEEQQALNEGLQLQNRFYIEQLGQMVGAPQGPGAQWQAQIASVQANPEMAGTPASGQQPHPQMQMQPQGPIAYQSRMTGSPQRASISPPHVGRGEVLEDRGRSHSAGWFNHSEKRHLTPEETKLNYCTDKEKYQQELLLQVKEKKEREQIQKNKKIEEDLKEEERVTREREELNNHFKKYGNQGEANEIGTQLPSALNQDTFDAGASPPKPGPPRVKRSPIRRSPKTEIPIPPNYEHVQSRINMNRSFRSPEKKKDTQNSNLRQISPQKKSLAMPKKQVPIPRPQAPVGMSKEVLEANMKLFNNSIAQMRANQQNLVVRYNTEISRLKDQKDKAGESSGKRESSLQQQVSQLQTEIDQIVKIIQRSGGMIVRQTNESASGHRGRQGRREQELRSQSQLQRKQREEILVNFDESPNDAGQRSRRSSQNQRLPPLADSKRSNGLSRQLSLQKLPHEKDVEPRKRQIEEIETGSLSKRMLPPLAVVSVTSSKKEEIIVDLNQPAVTQILEIQKPVKISRKPSEQQISQMNDLRNEIDHLAQTVNQMEPHLSISDKKSIFENKTRISSQKSFNLANEASPYSPQKVTSFHEQSLPHADLPLITGDEDLHQIQEKVSQKVETKVIQQTTPSEGQNTNNLSHTFGRGLKDETIQEPKASRIQPQVKQISTDNFGPFGEPVELVQPPQTLEPSEPSQIIVERDQASVVELVQPPRTLESSDPSQLVLERDQTSVPSFLQDYEQLRNQEESLRDKKSVVESIHSDQQPKIGLPLQERSLHQSENLQSIQNEQEYNQSIPIQESSKPLSVITEQTIENQHFMKFQVVPQPRESGNLYEGGQTKNAHLQANDEQTKNEHLQTNQLLIPETPSQHIQFSQMAPIDPSQLQQSQIQAMIIKNEPNIQEPLFSQGSLGGLTHVLDGDIPIYENNRQQRMNEIVGSFVESKKSNNEPILVKKVSRKKTDKPAAHKRERTQGLEELKQEQRIVIDNEIDQSLFDNKVNLRKAISSTYEKDPLDLNQKNFYDGPTKKLYNNELPLLDKSQKQAATISNPSKNGNSSGVSNPQLKVKRTHTASLGALNEELYKTQGAASGQPLPEQSSEQLSIGSGLFTNDSKVNDYKKISSFFDRQQQFQDIVYKQQNHFIDQSLGNAPRTEFERDQFPHQAFKYNKNDPFGVNMRLRQSLTNTNQILYHQDNARITENLVNPSEEPIDFQFGDDLQAFNILKELNSSEFLPEKTLSETGQYDANLYRDSLMINRGKATLMHTINEEQSELYIMNTDENPTPVQMPGPNFNFNDTSMQGLEQEQNDQI